MPVPEDLVGYNKTSLMMLEMIRNKCNNKYHAKIVTKLLYWKCLVSVQSHTFLQRLYAVNLANMFCLMTNMSLIMAPWVDEVLPLGKEL